MADMRDRLIDLLKGNPAKFITVYPDDWETEVEVDYDKIADHLLANGVILPPCKVGDTVYFPIEIEGEGEAFADVGTVFAIGIDERHIMWISARYESGLKYYHTSYDFGKTVFLTREEAEKALREKEK